jgi:cell wall-associated NlpC family hydrolase
MGYTQGGDRWSGIEGGYGKNGVPSCPPWGDCSSYATWIYWTVFGPPCLCSGADFINNDDWKAGYTGTMLETGEEIDCRSLLPADLIIYGTAYPGLHVAIYVGLNSDGQGVTIGHGGPGLQSVIWDEMGMPVLGCRSYLPDDVKSSNAVRTE